MKILWLTNIPLPEASILMNEEPSYSGGWLINTAKLLSEHADGELVIAFPKNNIAKIQVLKGKKIEYYAFPSTISRDVASQELNMNLRTILNNVNPDLVHIFGTEFGHTLEMVNECKKREIKNVISIQGLVSIIAKHYMANIPLNIRKRFTFRDFVKQDNIHQQQQNFFDRGILEIEAIKNTSHIIGRTTWDKACASQINSKAEYHFCNETLREEFYKHEWSIKTCEKYSIFVSQGSYPIKGLHYILEAMQLVLNKFPKAKLYIAGANIVKSDTLKEKLKKTSYTQYIEELVLKYSIKNNISFTGILDENEMCQMHLKANIFVCPSSIENSPNSLGEAMLLGVPCVASYVGGIPDILKDKEEGFLYQHDAPYMLAHYICEIFDNDDLAIKLSRNARARALKTHDIDENRKRLIEIYERIID